MSERIRCFIAVDVEEETLLAELTSLEQILHDTGADLKLVNPKGLHLTLRFLGEIPPQTLEAVLSEVGSINFEPFMVTFKGLGAFPNLRRINVIWVGITEGAEQLKALARKLETALRKLSFRPDLKEFSPHLTLARVRTWRNRDSLARLITDERSRIMGSMAVNSIRVKKSVLTPSGPVYSTLLEVKAHGPSTL